MSLLLAAALSICVAPGVADAAKKKGKAKTDKVGVMTYNLYLGSNLNPAVGAALASRTDLFADEVGFVNKDVIANAFDTRAIQIAKDIKKRNTDLVGLQEAALWKIGVPPDPGGRASSTQYDYIQTLLDELNKGARSAKQCKAAKSKAKKAGKKVKPCYQGYSLVVQQQEADIEFPGDFDNHPGPDGETCDLSSGACATPPNDEWTHGNDDTGFSAGEPPSPPFPGDANGDNGGTTDVDCTDTNPATGALYGNAANWGNPLTNVCMIHGLDGDLSLTMRDAIIKRNGAKVNTSNSRSSNYTNNFNVTVLGTPVSFTRGWTATDANVRGKKFTFLNTHLESETNGVRTLQAGELVAPGGPATAPNTVLVGDLNSDPTTPGGSPDAYNTIAAGGYRSLTGPALTSGHGELLNDTSNTLDGSRIDHILTNGAGIVAAGSSQVIDTFANGLWNSDHGGVFVQIKGKKQKAKKKK
jgi:endonuclease/exonuclease/phosphatase family metal-dependent hydrolase